MIERKDFPKWKVEEVCIVQGEASLEHGFHRRHKDGNPANNIIENPGFYVMNAVEQH